MVKGTYTFKDDKYPSSEWNFYLTEYPIKGKGAFFSQKLQKLFKGDLGGNFKIIDKKTGSISKGKFIGNRSYQVTKIKYKDGTSFKGLIEILNESKIIKYGEGVLFDDNGTRFEGEWENGMAVYAKVAFRDGNTALCDLDNFCIKNCKHFNDKNGKLIGEDGLGVSTKDGIIYSLKEIELRRQTKNPDIRVTSTTQIRDNRVIYYENKRNFRKNKYHKIFIRDGGFIDKINHDSNFQSGYNYENTFRHCNSSNKIIESRTKREHKSWATGRDSSMIFGFFRNTDSDKLIKEGLMENKNMDSDNKSLGEAMVIYQKGEKGNIEMKTVGSSGKNKQKLIVGEDNIIKIEKERTEE